MTGLGLLVLVMGAALFGPSAIVAVDLDEGRLARAEQRGCIPVQPEKQDLDEVVKGLTDGRGADAVIEAVGKAALVRTGIEIARPGGRVSVVGIITLEDVLEALLGLEIVDEKDKTRDMQELARRRWRRQAARLGVSTTPDDSEG